MPSCNAQVAFETSNMDEAYLRVAIALAGRLANRPWPNPPVGALVVKAGEVVGRGAHHGAGKAHAERIALAEAGDRARGATLYCTLEPCRHDGRTPPCTDAILAAGIARVVAGVKDLNPPASGGADLLRAAGLEVTLGLLAEECLELIWPFVASQWFARPYVELKTATSLDGRFAASADPAGQPVYLTGDAARRDVHLRRCWFDIVLVGAGTARRDHPRLDTRLATDKSDCPLSEPLAGCVSGFGSAHEAGYGKALALNRETWLCFYPRGHKHAFPAGAEVISCRAGPNGVDLDGLLSLCHERGLNTIMLECGPTLAASFLEAGLVDRWVQYSAPIVLGGGVAWPDHFEPGCAGFSLTRCERVGRDHRAVFDRLDFATVLKAASANHAERAG